MTFSILMQSRVHPLIALLICCGIAIGCGNTRGLRPQVLSLLLCNAVIWLMLHHRCAPSLRVLVLLPMTFLLWAQFHAACVMGLVVVGVWLAGRLLETVTSKPPVSVRREFVLLGSAWALSAVAVLITPHAITHYQYVAETLNLSGLRYTEEWAPPAALSLAVPDIYLYLLLLVVLVVLARSSRRPGWDVLALCAALLMLGFSGVRHIPLACIGAVPLMAEAIAHQSVPAPSVMRIRDWLTPKVAAAVLVVLLIFWQYPVTANERYARVEPVIGARALATFGQPRNVFTTYNTGAYVLFAWPQKLKVFVDSRADVYGDSIIMSARRARRGDQWQALFDQWDITAAVIARNDPLAKRLDASPEWRRLALDQQEVTYIKNASIADARETHQPGRRTSLQ